jgi:hypothetical protein
MAGDQPDQAASGLERPFAGQHVAAHGYVEHVLGCHRFLPLISLLLSPARPAGEQGLRTQCGLRRLLRRRG